jgi:TRAP-type C4-dicarboxylate transport system substrate-binding protein
MNLDKWNKISPEYQKIIEIAADEVIQKQFVDAKNEDAKWIKKAQEGGMEGSGSDCKSIATRPPSLFLAPVAI